MLVLLHPLQSFRTLSELLVGTWILFSLAWVIYARFFHPYAGIPGPFWASISNLWYRRALATGRTDCLKHPLHEIYGALFHVIISQHPLTCA